MSKIEWKANERLRPKLKLICSRNATNSTKMETEKRSNVVRGVILALGIVGPFIFALEPATNHPLPGWLIVPACLGIVVDCALIYSVFLDVRGSGVFKPNTPLISKHFIPIVVIMLIFQASLILSSFQYLQNALLNYSLILLPIGTGILFGQRALDGGVRPALAWLMTLTAYIIPISFLTFNPPQTTISKLAVLSPLLFGLPAIATWLARRSSLISAVR